MAKADVLSQWIVQRWLLKASQPRRDWICRARPIP
jgi:hypothetical protein